MSETLTNGVIVPDKGSRDWYADLRSNWLKLDSLMAGGNITVNPVQTEGVLVATITVGGKEYKLYQQDGDVSVKIDPSTENAEYPLVASTSAEANTGSVVMAPAVTMNPSTGAVTATSFKGKLEGNASTATNATKAVQDGAGAVIADTYATKTELNAKANNADVVHKSGNETIAGNKTFSATRTKFYKSLDLYHDEDYKLNTNPSVKAYQYIFFTGKSGWFSAFLENQVDTDGASYCNLSTRNTNEQSAAVQLAIDSNGVKTFKPATNNDISLGTSTNKWKAVYANSVVVNDKNVLTDANRIMMCKNVTGSNIALDGVVDCGDGNEKLKAWYIDESNTLTLAATKVTGKWKNISSYMVPQDRSGMFIKIG